MNKDEDPIAQLRAVLDSDLDQLEKKIVTLAKTLGTRMMRAERRDVLTRQILEEQTVIIDELYTALEHVVELFYFGKRVQLTDMKRELDKLKSKVKELQTDA